MMHEIDPEKIILETRRYEFSDGLRDIQLGITVILMGIFWFWLMFEPFWLSILIKLGSNYGPWLRTIVFILLFSLPVLAAFGLQSLMGYLRRRWLWRQSGQVKSSRIAVPTRVSIIAVIVFVGIVIVGLLLQHALETGEFYVWSLILAATGWAFGVTLIGMGRSIRLRRYVLLGLCGGLASTALLLYQSSFVGPGVTFSAGWGILLLASGIVVLCRVWPQISEGNDE